MSDIEGVVTENAAGGGRTARGRLSLDRALSFIGGPWVRALLVATLVSIFVTRRRWWSAATLLAATGGMGIINTGLKALIHRRRPAGLPGAKRSRGFSFPSGHSSGSVVFLGTMAYLIRTMTGQTVLGGVASAVAASLAFLIGRSRVELRAHRWSDVLAGYVVGATWLSLVLRVFSRPLKHEYERG